MAAVGRLLCWVRIGHGDEKIPALRAFGASTALSLLKDDDSPADYVCVTPQSSPRT